MRFQAGVPDTRGPVGACGACELSEGLRVAAIRRHYGGETSGSELHPAGDGVG